MAAPQNLQVQKNVLKKTIVFTWNSVDFSACHTSLRYYHVQIDKNGSTVRQYTTTAPMLTLPYSALSGKGVYRYRVYAEAASGDVTDWSSYTYFKL